jgi:hypothetical protein
MATYVAKETPLKTSVRLSVVMVLCVVSAAEAGKSMTVCRDGQGKPSFSDRGCPEGTEREGRHYSPSAQGYDRKWSADDVDMLNRHEDKSGTGREWYRTQRPQ